MDNKQLMFSEICCFSLEKRDAGKYPFSVRVVCIANMCKSWMKVDNANHTMEAKVLPMRVNLKEAVV